MPGDMKRGLLVPWLLTSAAGFAVASPLVAASTDALFSDGFDDSYFVMPYSANGSLPPAPLARVFALTTPIQKLDVALLVDTTASMGAELGTLKTSLSTSIIPILQALAPSLGVGVAAHDDVPFSGYGISGDLPFYVSLTPQGLVTTTPSDSQAAVNALTLHNGGDAPEAQIPALHRAAAASAISWPTGSVAASTPPPGTFGAMQFRSDALPIIVNLTDASSHNGKRALDKTGTSYDTAYQAIYTFPTWNVDDATTALIGHGARYIGIAADNGARALGSSDVYGYQAYLADKTGSNVTAASYVHGGACSAAQCCTGVNASGVAADGPGGSCRSVYSINTTGAGLATAITSGVASIVKTAAFDVYVQAYNDTAETTNVVGNFLLKVEPVAAGGTDPFSGALCVAFPSGQLADNFTGPDALVAGGDGVNDSISQINPAATYCFNVTLKPNTTVVATSVGQIFRAWLRVRAIKPDGSIALGQDRKLFFLVPPASP